MGKVCGKKSIWKFEEICFRINISGGIRKNEEHHKSTCTEKIGEKKMLEKSGKIWEKLKMLEEC